MAGHEVVCVENGAAAVEKAADGDYDVILMDVRMPVMNGLTATRRIRELPAPRGQVPVMAVTAQGFAQQIDLCRRAGMNGHIIKPFKQAVLLASIEDIATMSHDRPAALATPGSETEPDSDVAQDVEAANREQPHKLFDRAAFEEITRSLSADELTEHMRHLVSRCESLSHDLGASTTPGRARELVEQTHGIAGGAGTFGFLSLAAAARQFEVAAETEAPGIADAADQLAAALNASIPIMRRQ
jgi:CheY-like chemotaxis protein